MKLENQNIMIISNEPWGDIWYSKHNWANELSKLNNVFFINPPQKWHFNNVFNRKKVQEIKQDGAVKVIQYQNFLPMTGRLKLFFFINELIVAHFLKVYFKKNKKLLSLILWSFDPYRLVYPKKIGVSYSIFHCADDYTNRTLPILCQNVDYFISVAPDFIKKFEIYNKPIKYLPHGISKDEFDLENIDLKEISKIPKPYIFYVGNIDDRIDYLAIEKLLIEFKNEAFLFVGPLNYAKINVLAKKIFEENSFPNLFHIPSQHFKKIKYFIAKSKICIAPMDAKVKGNMINHHKLLQYFSQGKSVFSSKFSEYNGSSKDFIHMYSDISEVCDIFATALNECNNQVNQKQRIDFAEKHRYEKLIMDVEQFLS